MTLKIEQNLNARFRSNFTYNKNHCLATKFNGDLALSLSSSDCSIISTVYERCISFIFCTSSDHIIKLVVIPMYSAVGKWEDKVFVFCYIKVFKYYEFIMTEKMSLVYHLFIVVFKNKFKYNFLSKEIH